MKTGDGGATLDGMIRNLGNGIVVRNGMYLSMDTTFGRGQSGLTQCFEVKQGRVTRQILSSAIQFSSKKLWQNVVEVGGPATVQPSMPYRVAGQPSTMSYTQVHAPAIRLKGVGMVDLDRSGS
jgi:predicted Zn-dependent protease